MADAKGWKSPSIYSDDGISGTIDIGNRPEGARLLQDIASGIINAVIVSALDRIGRRALFILNFVDATKDSIQLVSCKESLDTSTASGRFVLTMFAALAEMERDTISERTVAALDARYSRDGIKSGLPPYGYEHEYSPKNGKDISINAQKAENVRTIYALRSEGLTLRAIALQVPVSFNTVKRILDNEAAYRGGVRGDSQQTWPIILV
jgi:site-specific DNA recombinase